MHKSTDTSMLLPRETVLLVVMITLKIYLNVIKELEFFKDNTKKYIYI